MREVFAAAAAWLDEKRPFALATLVALRGAATAPLGTTIAVEPGGRIVGNIGAGCYETDVVRACLETAADGTTRTIAVDLEIDDVITGGTACGAVMDIVVWKPASDFAATARSIAAGIEPVALHLAYQHAERGACEFDCTYPARERLVLVGATSLAAEIAAIARRLDLYVIVVDPRPAFATRERLPDADEIVLRWPDDYLPAVLEPTASIVVLSHDPKFDVPALRCALASPARFIGLLGSRCSQAARREALRAEGVDETAFARIHGPVGLDLGGETTAETAVSIVAEFIAIRRERSGMPLHLSPNAIHSPVPG